VRSPRKAAGVFALSLTLTMVGLVPATHQTTALAYNTYGWALRWTDMGYQFYSNGGMAFPTGAQANVDQAASEWSQQPTPVTLARDPNNPIIFVFSYSANDGLNGQGGCYTWGNNPNECAVGYIELNFYYSSNPAENTSVHEFGHAMGLDHSCVGNSVMSGPQPNCQNQGYSYMNTPTQDDVDGLNSVYPANNYSPGGGGGGCTVPTSKSTLPTISGVQYEANQTTGKVTGLIGQETHTVTVGNTIGQLLDKTPC